MPSRRVVVDHVTVGVSDLAISRAFYRAALAPLGFSEQGSWGEGDDEVTFGLADHDDFAISTAYPPGPGAHVAFAADTRDQVDAFYEAALDHGGRDNGAPAVRPEYSDHYYGGFVLDPDGHNVEAVCHAPERPERVR
jgi:catechol 2,3-dioxygenase-like lactoylglutathione lyase family enzyme